MSHALIIRRRAEHDLAEAGLWYESRRLGTALYFIRCADAAIALITRHPNAGPAQFGPFHRILISRFPFGIFYTATEAYWARFYDIATNRPIFAGARTGSSMIPSRKCGCTTTSATTTTRGGRRVC